DKPTLTRSQVESARRNNPLPIEGMKANVHRNGKFHEKMAGCRLTVNEHWGQPESKNPGGLWWENNILNRKKMTAGWQSKKAAPWKPSHELLQISILAHIKDGFRIFCGQEKLEDWAASVSLSEFSHVADLVYRNLFTTRAYDQAKEKTYNDTIYLNNLLQNRDTLFYIEVCHAIKAGDIGRVVNVSRMWMVMMRSKKTMPKYADVIFETLGRLSTYSETLRKFFLHNWLVNVSGTVNGWKEVDLLQEHQNFWAKAVYSAKGSNRSWEWLGMITPIIFELRSAMSTVQKAFEISSLSTKHTIPDKSKEVHRLSDALADENIQTFVPNRASNEGKKAVRDLFEEGSKYPNQKGAFKIFRKDARKAENLGFVESVVGDASDIEEESDERPDEDYEITLQDLA
ncbi:hypothetical protein EV359DRAFT_69240, partial [Lentinula novae-zelandiae]